MPLGDRGVEQVEAFFEQCNTHENPYVCQPPAWIRQMQIKGEK